MDVFGLCDGDRLDLCVVPLGNPMLRMVCRFYGRLGLFVCGLSLSLLSPWGESCCCQVVTPMPLAGEPASNEGVLKVLVGENVNTSNKTRQKTQRFIL